MKRLILALLISTWIAVGVFAQGSGIETNIRFQEHVQFEHWPNCIRLGNDEIELIITTDVGPRIIWFGYVNEQNMFYVSSNKFHQEESWNIFGGHRLWHAPESSPRSYVPDNNRVKYSLNGATLKLTQDIEPTTSIIKELEITLGPGKNEVVILHRLINKNLWDLELSVWPITACASGGRAIIPHEPYIAPSEYLLPVRPVVLWGYTKMTDARYSWGSRFIQAHQDPAISSETKIGVLNKQQWAAYYLNNTLFVKTFEYNETASYPDYGCNNEIYINGQFLEVETLSPITKLAPQGYVEHIEYWSLNRVVDLSENDQEIERTLKPIIEKCLRKP